MSKNQKTDPEEQREPKNRHFSPVERRIIKAAANGETADCTDLGEGDDLARVSGKFIADLWLDRIEGATMHPMGISLKGLEIEGEMELGGPRQTQGGRDRLVGFHAADCVFKVLQYWGNMRCESLIFERCRFESAGVDDIEDGVGAIDLSGTEIDGSLGFSDCTFTGVVQAQNLKVTDQFTASKSTFGRGLNLWSAHIGGSLRLSHSKLGKNFEGVSLSCPDGEIGGQLSVLACTFSDGIYGANLRASEIYLTRSIFEQGSGTSVHLGQAELKGRMTVKRIRCRGGMILTAAKFGGEFELLRSIFDQGIDASHININSAMVLMQCRVRRDTATEWTLSIGGARVKSLFVGKSAIDGHIGLKALEVATELAFRNCVLGRLRSAFEAVPQKDCKSLVANGAKVGVECNFINCAIFCELNLAMIDAGGFAIGSSFICRERNSWSVRLDSTRIANIISFKDSVFSTGLQLPLLSASEIQIEGCWISEGGDSRLRQNYAIWASESEFSRRVSFACFRNASGAMRRNRLSGKIDYSLSRIGESFLLRSTDCHLASGNVAARFSSAIDLSRIRLQGDLMLAPYSFMVIERLPNEETPAWVEGCINADDAEIQGDVVVHETTVAASGDIVRPLSHFDTEERVSKRKRGVALSLRDATIEGELEIGTPSIAGIVDLRDSNVGLINDGGGDRWEVAGVKPGHLLLDGLTYRDLDNVHDFDESDTISARPQSDAATRRLDWLTMQYPGRQPTPDTFVPQPYEQLASIFAAEGNERARRQILVEKRNLQRKHGRLGLFDRVVQWLLMGVSLYGYSPARALGWTLAYLALGTLAAMALETRDAFILATIDGQPKAEFSALVYAIDSAIPIIDLNQDSGWTIDPGSLPGWLSIEVVLGVKAAYEIIGMLLISITILTLTGTLRDKE